MHLVFDIFQGIGIAAAVGVRPFLPALAVGALGAADVQIDFAHSSFSFLQGVPFLLAMVIGVALLGLAERRLSADTMDRGAAGIVVALLALTIGALEFGGSLCRGGYEVWPGIVGGAICALIGVLATRPLLARVKARLDAETGAGMVAIFAEAAALVGAVLSVVAPPVGVIVLLLLLWLLFAGRGRDDNKYAGLRILR